MTKTIQNPKKLDAPAGFAKQLLAGNSLKDIKTNQLKTNDSLLRYDEWKEIDDQVIDVVRTRLDAVDDLLENDLTLQLGGLGTMVSEYETQSDVTDAAINMSPQTESDKDTQEFDIDGVPVPVVHKDFSLDIRRLQASRNRGDGLDVSVANAASRKVSEASEKMLVNGTDVQLGGHEIYGYTNHPDVITGDATGEFSADLDNVYDTTKDMIKELDNEGFPGPYMYYVAPGAFEDMRQRYSDGSGDTGLDAVREKFPEIDEVKKLHELDTGELVMVQLTSDVVDIAVAETPQTVEWDSPGGFKVNFKVMAAWAPRIKSDFNGKCGVAYYTGADS